MKAYIVERQAVEENIKKLLAHAKGTPIWAVLKGDGYGLGAAPMAKLCKGAGIDRYAVTEPSEAKAIREAGLLEEPVLMLRATTDREELSALVDLGVTLTMSSREDAEAIAAISREKNTPVSVHLKIDTGMGRYGFFPKETETVKEILKSLPETVTVTGVFTHFHSSFAGEAGVRRQATAFTAMCDALEKDGFSLGERHVCNSSAFLRFPDLHFDGVRLGSAILGRIAVPNTLGLTKVGYAEATVDELHLLPKGHSVGYGAATVVKRDTRSAVLPIGYCHGFTLKRDRDVWRWQDCIRGMLSNLKLLLRPSVPMVTVNGKPCKTLGHVGMLHTSVDVTDIPCAVGDVARLEINPLMLHTLPVVYR